ncbi:MAG: hypothetical protein ACXABY_00450 [Candidatus Thorarchaeota archaeon]|jgi:hypothetical protein
MDYRKLEREIDLENLAVAFYDNLSLLLDGEGWGIGVDSKRPFGNSHVESDIFRICNIEPEGKNHFYTPDQMRYARDLWVDLPGFLRDKFRNA